jgi:hypothetical protein
MPGDASGIEREGEDGGGQQQGRDPGQNGV